MIGKMVIGVSGPCSERNGQIISEESFKILNDVHETYLVAWEDGCLESFYKHQFQTERRGCGVYYA